jgi:hypothetical protein
MARRSTPDWLDAARRAATLARLVSAGMSPDHAEAALDAWAARTAPQGRLLTPAEWETAYQEIRRTPDLRALRRNALVEVRPADPQQPGDSGVR